MSATGAFPPGYLSYGELSHPLQRERVCVVCHLPLTTTTRTQVTHPGECAAKRKSLTRKRWGVRKKWKRKGEL